MICRKCKQTVQDGPYCCQCGARQEVRKQKAKSRGNGQGSVYQLKNGRYLAIKTCGYYLDDSGKKHRVTVSKCFEKKKDAVAALPLLNRENTADGKAERKAKITFKELYDLWLPTHRAGKDTLGNYKAAFKYFSPLYHERAGDVDVDDLQECIDECPRGKSTKRNMRTTVGLMYKYGIPRGYFPEKLNLADYLTISGDEGAGGVGLPMDYLEAIRNASESLPGADYVLAQCYLGFRPSELLALRVEDYSAKERAFVGGAKTEAGKNRTVTVSPKIQPIIDRLTAGKTTGQVFCTKDGGALTLRAYRAMFYSVLDALGLENPTFVVHDQQKHTYTPHSCRHTFATLMKRVDGADKDKLALIGHSSDEQLRYYQDVDLNDLRRITDNL